MDDAAELSSLSRELLRYDLQSDVTNEWYLFIEEIGRDQHPIHHQVSYISSGAGFGAMNGAPTYLLKRAPH